jgi:hypothetical protein
MRYIKVRYVELESLDAGTLAEFLCGLIVAGIVRGYRIAGVFEFATDRFTDPAGTACY